MTCPGKRLSYKSKKKIYLTRHIHSMQEQKCVELKKEVDEEVPWEATLTMNDKPFTRKALGTLDGFNN